MVENDNNSLVFSFPEVHADARLRVEFQRTLRIPDDNKTHHLPPGLGRFPLRHVEDHSQSVPDKWNDRGGVFLPMYQSEALWINFIASDYPFAIKIAAGKINAVTGDPWTNGLSQASLSGVYQQDYVVAPGQPWLDGFSVEKGVIRQFVAMPLGRGFTAEEQITGESEFGGIQIMAFPLKKERYLPKVECYESVYMCESKINSCTEPDTMGLGAGGRMKQDIYTDDHGVEAWDTRSSSRCFVHLANSEQYTSITGKQPPTTAPSVDDYYQQGLPWFDYYDETRKPLSGSEALSKLKSVESMKLPSHVDGGSKPVSIFPHE